MGELAARNGHFLVASKYSHCGSDHTLAGLAANGIFEPKGYESDSTISLNQVEGLKRADLDST